MGAPGQPQMMGQPHLAGHCQMAQGQSTGPALLSVAVDGLGVRYQLSDADLRETFQRWGPLLTVQIYREGMREVGVISFADRVDASDAQRQLHGQACVFDGRPGTLAVVPGPPEQLSSPVPRTSGFPSAPCTAPCTTPMGPGSPALAPGSGEPGQGGPGMPVGPPPLLAPQTLPGRPPAPGQPCMAGCMTGAMPKSAPSIGQVDGKGGKGAAWNGYDSAPWTCKVVVQAEQLHPSFPTAQKIVGENAANLNHIRLQASSEADTIVRLQGRNSGQPPSEPEAQEPMFLWISSESSKGGKMALEMVQDLLNTVYEEHKGWCSQHGQTHPNWVKATVIENNKDPA